MTRCLRIAVADDEPDMRDFLERMLPLCGHKVVSVAETGRQLVDHCRQQHPDLVITDIRMPDMDGIDAAAEICREQCLPIILVSAYHDPELISRAEQNYIMAYLVKPIGKAALEPAITVATRRFDELQALRKETSDLRQALADRKVIEQAKGVLMSLSGVSEKDAFKRLQELAADQNLKLVDAARSVLAMERVFRPPAAT